MARPFDPERGQLKGDQSHRVADRVARTFDASESGILIYRTSSEAEEKRLTWFDRTGKTQGVTGEAGDYWDVRISPDGQKLASNAGDPNSEIWVDDLTRAVRMRLTIDPDADHGVPVWSPDSNRIAFMMRGKVHNGIYQKYSSGAGGQELLLSGDSDTWIWPTSWSRDGKFILYSRGTEDTDIWILPLAGDRRPRPFVQAQAKAYDGQFSPDGRWVAYTSEESGRGEVYVIPFEAGRVLNTEPRPASAGGGGRWQVSAGGRSPRWRRDGKEIFYLSPTNQMMAAEVEEKGNSLVVRAAQALFRCTPVPSIPSSSPYDVSPDGKKLVINSYGDDNTPLILLVNWTANLK
jgi:Tol biopolymer transport system component